MTQTCVICGWVGSDVRTRLVAWRDPLAGRQFDAVPRCVDVKACRDRLEGQGEAWPVKDRAA